MAVDLLFRRPPTTSAALTFGETDDAPAADAVLSLEASLPGLGGVRLVVAATLTCTASLPGLSGTVDMHYNSDAARPLVCETRVDWQAARPGEQGMAVRWRGAQPYGVALDAQYQRAQGVAHSVAAAWRDTQRVVLPVGSAFQAALSLRAAPAAARYQDAGRVRLLVVSRLARAAAVRAAAVGVRYQDGGRAARAVVDTRMQAADLLQAAVRQSGGRALTLHYALVTRYQAARRPPIGLSPVVPVDPGHEPCYTPPPGGAVPLLFRDPWTGSAALLFTCPGGSVEPGAPEFVIPLLRVYMTVHSIDTVLLPSLERVPLSSVSISTNDDGFGWSMTASGPMQLMDQLAPSGGVPQRVRVTIDGIDWVFACEPPERSRKFGERGVQVRGSSITALLGAPHMSAGMWSSSTARTAQQLIAQALEFTGVDLDWRIDDWLVPAGAWSHQGTPLSVAQRIAEAAGAVLRSHRTEATLQIAPRYPHMPWAWPSATPTVRMPGQIITADTLQAVGSTRYSAVYVSGQTSGGVLGHVVRSGSAGDVLASQVTDALITHELAARQRGSAILAAAAITRRQPITVPLLTGGTAPGLILPGYLIEVVEPEETWRGLVRGITVTAGLPTVRQQLDVERADGPAGGGGIALSSVNLFRRLQSLQPEAPVLTGQITAVSTDGTASVQMTGGGVLTARNPLGMEPGQRVFLQGGAIAGQAPDLPYMRIEI